MRKMIIHVINTLKLDDTDDQWHVCAFINLSGISSDQILNSLLIEYKDNVWGLRFIIPMLITVEQLIN